VCVCARARACVCVCVPEPGLADADPEPCLAPRLESRVEPRGASVEAEVDATMSIDGALYAPESAAGAGERRRATLHATCSGLVQCWQAIPVARRLSNVLKRQCPIVYLPSQATVESTFENVCHTAWPSPAKPLALCACTRSARRMADIGGRTTCASACATSDT